MATAPQVTDELQRLVADDGAEGAAATTSLVTDGSGW